MQTDNAIVGIYDGGGERMSGDKHITMRILQADPVGHVQVAAAEKADTVREGHSVQDAVLGFYALPGACNAISLWRGGQWVKLLWWPRADGDRTWGKDWYSTIQDGDVVMIYIHLDDEQDIPDGPRAPSAGGHGVGVRGWAAGVYNASWSS